MNSNRDVNFYFLGGLFPKNLENKIENNSKKNMQNAANILQWNIVNGLDKNLDKSIRILNCLFVGSYPLNYKRAFINEFRWSHKTNTNDINIKFINIFGIKQFSRSHNIKKCLNKVMINDTHPKIIFVYSLNAPFIAACKYIKKRMHDVQICLIVPDLPEFMNLGRKDFLYRYLKNIEINIINNNLKYIDSFVFLTEFMNEKINIHNKPFTVVEGMVDIDYCHNIEVKEKKFKEKVIFYSGGLYEKYGIGKLLDIMDILEKEKIKLILCGNGDLEEKIVEKSKQDRRIQYLGLISNKEVKKLQKKSTILINPRPTELEYTKYSFPSKNLEYMLSGTPVLTTNLKGMPSEYKDYVYLFEEESIEKMAEKILQILLLPNNELFNKGYEARKFVLNNKNNVIQTKKILKLVE